MFCYISMRSSYTAFIESFLLQILLSYWLTASGIILDIRYFEQLVSCMLLWGFRFFFRMKSIYSQIGISIWDKMKLMICEKTPVFHFLQHWTELNIGKRKLLKRQKKLTSQIFSNITGRYSEYTRFESNDIKRIFWIWIYLIIFTVEWKFTELYTGCNSKVFG